MKYGNNKIVYEIGDWVTIIKATLSSFWYKNEVGKTYKVLDMDAVGGLCVIHDHHGDSYLRFEDARPASQEEIDKADDKIMVGEYEVTAHNYMKGGEMFISVGCQVIKKDLFLKIGKKAGWL